MTQISPLSDLRRYVHDRAMPPWFHRHGNCESYVAAMSETQRRRIASVAGRYAVELRGVGRVNAASTVLELAGTAWMWSRP